MRVYVVEYLWHAALSRIPARYTVIAATHNCTAKAAAWLREPSSPHPSPSRRRTGCRRRARLRTRPAPPWRSAIWRTSERPRPQPPEDSLAAGGAVERLEHPLAFGRRDPLAASPTGDPRRASRRRVDGDADRRAAVLDRVLEEVADQAAKQRRVALDLDRRAALREARDARARGAPPPPRRAR